MDVITLEDLKPSWLLYVLKLLFDESVLQKLLLIKDEAKQKQLKLDIEEKIIVMARSSACYDDGVRKRVKQLVDEFPPGSTFVLHRIVFEDLLDFITKLQTQETEIKQKKEQAEMQILKKARIFVKKSIQTFCYRNNWKIKNEPILNDIVVSRKGESLVATCPNKGFDGESNLEMCGKQKEVKSDGGQLQCEDFTRHFVFGCRYKHVIQSDGRLLVDSDSE